MVKRVKIAQRKKSLILSEVAKPDCVILSLAKSHNISKGTIYKWLKQRTQPAAKVVGELAVGAANNDFVELSVIDSKNIIIVICKRHRLYLIIFLCHWRATSSPRW